jgi:hypothetical protein
LSAGERHWFEISHDGWRRLSASRALGRLLLEALQNAFDEAPSLVTVELRPDAIVVEDDSERGFGDERLVYTVFLSDKQDDPTRRGRMGRGLKELIAAMDAAVVETVGTTIIFDAEGRRTTTNERKRGTRIELRRQLAPADLEEAEQFLRLVVPPKGTTLKVGGRAVRRPRLILALSSCELETVVIQEGVERATSRTTKVSLYTPRKGETPHLFEMGVPIQAWDVPWHVDVEQRVPLTEGRDAASERYKLQLKALLLESMIHRYLDKRDLRADWVHDVISRWPVRMAVLDAFVSKVFPRGAVLGGTSRANDRARQIGAHVIEASALPHGTFLSLSRVIETSDDYVRRRSAEFGGEDVEPDEKQQQFAEAVRWLARRVAGRVVRIRFFARDPSDAGLLEDATTDVEAKVISFNVKGPLRFDDPLDPYTLGVVLHEIAHLETAEHDRKFIDRLQHLAAHTTKVFAEGGPDLAEAFRRGDPDRKSDRTPRS